MKLIEALEVLRDPLPEDAPALRVGLACGFTPLHLETFLAATLRQAVPGTGVEVETGLFGDLLGNLERLDGTDVAAVVVEWQDLDPRLGFRSLGGWRPDTVHDIVERAGERVRRLEALVRRLAASTTVVLCPPTLPLPPLFPQSPLESGAPEMELRQVVTAVVAALARDAGVRVVSSSHLDAASPLSERLDARSDITKGFPYSLAHAASVAGAIAHLVADVPPKKGIITDLDDTLWRGLIGEVGAEGVGWTLDADAQGHGLYQQMLSSLAAAGVLVGVASKNEADVVASMFERDELLLGADQVFPFEVGWGRKSESVRRILDTWNISADAVVFVDDSPTEVAEVQAAFPDMECLVFPARDHAELVRVLALLRQRFGKRAVAEEDTIRLASIRGAASMPAAADDAGYSDEFLRSAEGALEFTCDRALDPRALELINKTNQFNLNGRRIAESTLRKSLEDPAAFLLTVSYRDRFGPLGKIASVVGRKSGAALAVESWVMSCRAFSRRIEHHSLAYLFDRFGVEEITFDYEQTARNSVLREFFDSLGDGAPFRVTRDSFAAAAPPLVHQVSGSDDGDDD